jgi:hypothetical protein
MCRRGGKVGDVGLGINQDVPGLDITHGSQKKWFGENVPACCQTQG